MSGVTDLEYPLLSHIAYFDEITEELKALRDNDTLPIKLCCFTKILKRLNNAKEI